MKFGIGIHFDGEKVLKMVSTLYPDPRVQGGPKQGLGYIYSLNRETRQKFYKTKVEGKDHFSGGGSYFWDANPDLEGPGPHVLLEPWSIIFRQSLLHKSCSPPSQKSTWSVLDLLDLALTLNQGSGALNRVWSASTASTVQLGEYFIKQKL